MVNLIISETSILMSEYRLQTELSDETQREMALYSEKYALQTEIQNQKKKLSKSFYTSTKIFSLLVLMNVLLSFVWQRPADFFVVIIYGVVYTAEIVWLMFGLQKRQRKLEEWQSVVEDTEMQNYRNQ